MVEIIYVLRTGGAPRLSDSEVVRRPTSLHHPRLDEGYP